MFGKFFKIEDNWVVFYDLFSRNNNGDSIRPIAAQLKKEKPEMRFFFVSKTNKNIDMADEVIKPHSLRYNYVISKAKYLFSPMGFPKKQKRKGQIWVQTWHGTPLKKLYLSREDTKKSRKYVSQFAKADYFCSSCDFCHEAFSEAMQIKEEQFIDSGLPRNDILFNYDENSINKIKEKIGLPKDKKVLFYCPTWRRYDFKATLPMDLTSLKAELKDKYCIIIRSHVGKHQWVDINNNPIEINDGEFVFNVAEYPNITELYLISDVLISDYSSSIFDYAILGRPQIFYAYDLELYKKEFKLYFDYKDFIIGDMPTNTKELIESVKDIEKYTIKYGEKALDFKEKFCKYETGKASEIILNKILNKRI